MEINLASDGVTVQSVAYLSFTTAPVTWLGFKAVPDNGKVNLSWQTTSEINTNYFIVQKSTDGIHFTNVEQVKADGNSTNINNYSAVDAQPFGGENYYRIQQTDVNGKISYSTTIEITFDANNKISIVPNIIHGGDLSLITNESNETVAQLEIADGMGRMLASQQLNIGQGQGNHSIDISRLAAGEYFIILTINNTRQTARFIKE